MIKEGTLIELQSGNQFKIIKVYDTGHVDMEATKPLWYWMPDYLPVYFSIKLENYKIL